MEVGQDHAVEVTGLLASRAYRDIRAHKDYQQIARFITAASPRQPQGEG
jgi:hypothetical protein